MCAWRKGAADSAYMTVGMKSKTAFRRPNDGEFSKRKNSSPVAFLRAIPYSEVAGHRREQCK